MSRARRLLVLWLTGRCNLRCRYCYAADGPAADMDRETAIAAIEAMGDHPFKLQFAGGEPLLNRPLLEEILEYIREKKPGVSCAIQTNGTLVDAPTAGLLKRFRVAVGVSLDGRPQINEKLRGKTAQAVEGIRILGSHGIMVNLNTVVTAENAAHLADMVDMAVYLGNVGGIGLDLLRLGGRARDGGVSPTSADGLRRGLLALKERLDAVNGLLPRPLIVREFEKAKYALAAKQSCADYCYAAQGNSFVVLPGGDCYPCGSLAGVPQYSMGNVHSTVHPLRIDCTRPEKCEGCVYRRVCSGGCPSRGLLCGGFDELDCLMKKISFQFAEHAKKEENQ